MSYKPKFLLNFIAVFFCCSCSDSIDIKYLESSVLSEIEERFLETSIKTGIEYEILDFYLNPINTNRYSGLLSTIENNTGHKYDIEVEVLNQNFIWSLNEILDQEFQDQSVDSGEIKNDCRGGQSCITQIRELVSGAGYRVLTEEYLGQGSFSISAFQYGSAEPILMTYIMDCNCEPIDFLLYNDGNSLSTQNIHRCGRIWKNHELYLGGQWGDYCSENCYVELYPN